MVIKGLRRGERRACAFAFVRIDEYEVERMNALGKV